MTMTLKDTEIPLKLAKRLSEKHHFAVSRLSSELENNRPISTDFQFQKMMEEAREIINGAYELIHEKAANKDFGVFEYDCITVTVGMCDDGSIMYQLS